MSPTVKPAKKASGGFTDEEKAAMREAVLERRRGPEDGESAVLAKIAAMKGSDRTLAQRFHAIVKANAPGLSPRTWYGMPAYSNEEGKVVCFFQDAAKFKARYASIGFSDKARLDDGAMWPIVYALKELSPAEEAKIGALLKKAAAV